MDNDRDEQASTATTQADEPGRRAALLKIGKYGAYVAPAVLALVLGNRAEAACSCA